MYLYLKQVKTTIYDQCAFEISDYEMEIEGKAYGACRFKLNGKQIIARQAKQTPKKIGQFVTFWHRSPSGETQPFSETDSIDFFIINVKSGSQFGQFVIPKAELIKRGIISSQVKAGKRGFRVYPLWDIAKSKQAINTQKWQLHYFYEVKTNMDFELIKKLYHAENQ